MIVGKNEFKELKRRAYSLMIALQIVGNRISRYERRERQWTTELQNRDRLKQDILKLKAKVHDKCEQQIALHDKLVDANAEIERLTELLRNSD